jgi:hypothetical protein
MPNCSPSRPAPTTSPSPPPHPASGLRPRHQPRRRAVLRRRHSPDPRGHPASVTLSRTASPAVTAPPSLAAPGTLGRSDSPPIPSAAYHFFHVITVGLDTPVRRTISLVPSPSPASSTIRARCASPARIDVDRTHEASTSRSRGGTSTHTVKAINGASAKHHRRSRHLAHATLAGRFRSVWQVMGSNHRRLSRRFYSPFRDTTRGSSSGRLRP